MITQEQWLSMARSFLVDTLYYKDVYIELRHQTDGTFKWLIFMDNLVLSKSELCFVYYIHYKTQSTNFLNKHFRDTRFDTYQEAYDYYLKFKSSISQ